MSTTFAVVLVFRAPVWVLGCPNSPSPPSITRLTYTLSGKDLDYD